MPIDLVSPSSKEKSPKFVLTGRWVFAILCCFFGVIFSTNFIMATLAIKTFSGEVTTNPYERGLHFNNEIAQAEIQKNLGWRVEGRFSPLADGVARLNFHVGDKSGASVSGLTVEANLEALTDRRRDHRLETQESTPGVYSAIGQASPGVYNLAITLKRDGETKFQSRNRVTIQ